MNKLHKIFSVVLTAAVAMSLLVVSGVAPVSADNNLWSQVVTPSKTNQVMANNITASSLLTTAMNGDLYAYVKISGTTAPDNGYRLAKSTTGGRAWTYVNAPDQTQGISAIFCSKSEANVLYIAQGSALYKSIDSGATFVARGTLPSGTITAIGASLAGGSYKVIVGGSDNTWFQDEGQFFLSFSAFGNWSVAGGGVVLDLKLSPNFAVDQGIVALAETAGGATVVRFSTGGGVWGGNLQPVTLPSTVTTMGEIALPSDFTASAAIFFVGVNGATNAGLYRVTGSTAVVAPTLLDANAVASVDILGAFATANIIYGTTGGVTRYTTNSGQSWSSGAKQTMVAGGNAWVAFKSDYATSLTAYVLEAATTGANDESGFFMSTDSGKNWNAIALLNSTIGDINMNQLAMASNGDMFMITSANAGSAQGAPDTFTLTSVAGGNYFAGDAFTITSGAAGTVTVTGNVVITGAVAATGINPNQTIVFTAAGQVDTVTALGAGSVTWANDGTSAATAAAVAGSDANGLNPVAASGTPFNVDMNPVVVTLVGNVSPLTFSFTSAGQVSSVFTTTNAGGTVTWTASAGATLPTAAMVADAAPAAVITAGQVTNLGFVAIVVPGNHSLWRYFNGNWERVKSGAASTAMNMIAVSPNYVTDKAVFFVDGSNLINYSTNNGNTFSAQSVSAGSIVALQVLDLNTFVAATNAGAIVRTTNNGFIWNTVSSAIAPAFLVRSSDGTTLAAVTSTGVVSKSTDLGLTWSAVTTAASPGTVTAAAFQNGSNNVIWATTVAGLFSIDLSATTVAWSANAAGATGGLDSALFANGVAVGSGIAPTGSTVTYALNSANGNVARHLSVDSTISGNITAGATPLFATASALFVSPAVGSNKLTVIADSNKIFTYTDQFAAAVAGVTATGTTGANPTSTAVVNWTALTGADRYNVAIIAGSTAVTDPYTATFAATLVNGTTTTLTGLATNTTYTVSVWAVRTSATGNATTLSFAGTKTFSTQPGEVSVPINLAPAAGSTGIAITPGLAWGAVAGATSYTVELSTVNTFATLVGTKQTTTIPAFAWTTPALAYSTTYYWRVTAITATGSSDPVVSVFTTMAAPTTAPSGGGGGPGVTVTSTVVTITSASTETPAYVWAIIGIGALLVIVVIVLVVRTRRVA